MTIACDVGDALIFVDEHHVGTVASLKGRPLALRPGLRRLEVRREGFFAYYRDLQITKGTRQKLVVKLRREPF